jgi:GxxExxY protein
MDADECSRRIIGAAIEVHRLLGPGLLETTYEAALAHQLKLDGMRVARQLVLPAVYKDLMLQDAYRIDLLVEDAVVIEVKSVEKLMPIHQSQVLTYLRFSNRRVGLLINFNTVVLREGIKRLVNQL